ncbi:MAG TPA: hypothetical protein VNS58_07685 [Puia sp.]|nr:hypothetical protein [Puia sp.]
MLYIRPKKVRLPLPLPYPSPAHPADRQPVMAVAAARASLLKALIDTIDLRLGAFRPGTGPFNDSSFIARSGYPILNPERSSSPGPGYSPFPARYA